MATSSEGSKKRKAVQATNTQTVKRARKDSKVAANPIKVPVRTSKEAVTKAKAPTKASVKPDQKSKEHSIEEEILDSEEDDDEVEDDQTAALLQGFESSDDEEEVVTEPNLLAPVNTIPALPASDALQKSLSQTNASTESPGVIYVGRIPHGFFEHQMRSYFSQFGDITRLRLSRNRRTGASKHFAFIEFKSDEVAQIVADTMDNYLMFGHILKVKLIPQQKVHPELFKGAGKRFKKVPWNRIDRFKLQATDRKGWRSRVDVEERRRQEKANKLSELGYNFSAPDLRKLEDVPSEVLAITSGTALAKEVLQLEKPQTVSKKRGKKV